MSLSVELDHNWTEWTNKFGKLDILVNLKNIGKLLQINNVSREKVQKLYTNLNIYYVPALPLGKKQQRFHLVHIQNIEYIYMYLYVPLPHLTILSTLVFGDDSPPKCLCTKEEKSKNLLTMFNSEGNS